MHIATITFTTKMLLTIRLEMLIALLDACVTGRKTNLDIEQRQNAISVLISLIAREWHLSKPILNSTRVPKVQPSGTLMMESLC